MSQQDRDKLRVLLEHWIEHNTEHGEEFQNWAQKAKGFGANNVHEHILKAVGQLGEANVSLSRAVEELKANP